MVISFATDYRHHQGNEKLVFKFVVEFYSYYSQTMIKINKCKKKVTIETG